MPPKVFWTLAGIGVAGGALIWFFGKRPAYVIAGDPTVTTSTSDDSNDSNDASTSDAPTENNNGQQ